MVIIHFFTISLIIFTAVFITLGLCTMFAVKGVKKIWGLALITVGILFFIQTPDEHERYETFIKMKPKCTENTIDCLEKRSRWYSDSVKYSIKPIDTAAVIDSLQRVIDKYEK